MPINFSLNNHLFFKNTSTDLSNTIFSQCVNGNEELDIIGVFQIMSSGMLVGDRTLVKEIKRLPTDDSIKGFERIIEEIENKKNKGEILSPIAFSENIYNFLVDEIMHIASQSYVINIFLSGGMDSRIISAIIHNLQKEGIIDNKIVSYTWGLPESRDIVYAKRIADYCGWEHHTLLLSSEVLKNNIYVSAENGAIYSPIHIHGLNLVRPHIQDTPSIFCTWGDSLGKGKFSGVSIKDLPPFISLFKKHPNYLKWNKKTLLDLTYSDIKSNRSLILGKRLDCSTKLIRELDYHTNYLNGLLNHCIHSNLSNCPVFQLFTSDNVVKNILSHPEYYRNTLYKNILDIINDEFFIDLPWSKTGARYGSKNKGDNLKQNHHKYWEWIRVDLADFIEDTVFSNNELLKLFDVNLLKYSWSYCKNSSVMHNTIFDGFFCWLASLSLLMNKFNLTVKDQRLKENTSYNIILEHINSFLHYVVGNLK